MNDQDSPNYDQPVAYDAEGRPLYAHPPVGSVPVEPTPAPAPAAPQFVHLARPAKPMKPVIDEETKRRHEESKRLYPRLNLSESEYVISAVRRHIIGLIIPITLGILLMAASLSILLNYDVVVQTFNLAGSAAEVSTVTLPVLLFTLLITMGTFIVYYVYVNNKFYLTNESVIQEIQVSLFSRLEQTVSLVNIEDASYTQRGILQTLINYGSIRLSTEGDETTYRFTYVANPKMHIATLNNAVEAFKNGRPVDNNDD